MSTALQVAAMLGAPLLAHALVRRVAVARVLGPVGVSYALGILAASVPGVPIDAKVSRTVAEALVPLSIPLLLFCTDVPRWLTLARPALVSFALAAGASVLSALFFGTYLVGGDHDGIRAAGMLAACYVGGTPNLNAVGMALGVGDETFVLVNAADVVVGAAYLMFLLTVAPPLVRMFLPRWTGSSDGVAVVEASGPISARDVAVALGLSMVVTALTVGATLAIYGTLAPVPILLGVSATGLGLSFVPRVRRLRGSFEAGEYAMLVFCVAIGSLVDVGALGASSAKMLVLVASVQLGTVVLHLSLAKLFRIDADTALITSTAAVFGPPFVAPVARALGNRELVASGVTLGLAGFALGTWLGLFTAWALGA